MNVALVVIFAFLAFALFLGIRARRGQDMDLEQWTVGGRGFGTLFVFLLLAGEIYTTFTFLGGSGWAYGEGGPAFYILSYGCLAYVMSYWLLPAVWRYAKEHRLHSQSDFFVKKYESKASASSSRWWRSWRWCPTSPCSSRGSGSSCRRPPTGRYPPC